MRLPGAGIGARRGNAGRLAAVATSFLLFQASGSAAMTRPEADTLAELSRLSIEDLANIEVASVSKSAQPLSDAPAAIYVITQDDIARSGALNIPDILRLAPNLQVAQITATTHAISARGFNGGAADKLLVLIDGRSAYTPFSHGVFWDVQATPPQDIERIEVISGPGATLWGANAVNGVINVVTRKSSDTQGGVAQLGAGDREQRAYLRYGGAVTPDLTYRAYVEGVGYKRSLTPAGADAQDGWRKGQGGFRLDWTPSGDLVTLQGDIYDGSQRLTGADASVSGHNLIARWTRPTGGGGALQVQAYYDHLRRSREGALDYRLSTYDLDVQHSFSWGGVHDVVWGGGYRVTEDNFVIVPSSPNTQLFDPVRSRQVLSNVFAQDAISLTPALKLTLGLKLEDAPYSGRDLLPSARLSWKPTDSTLIWAAVSRAVRTPSRLDRDFVQRQGSLIVLAGRDFRSETLIAYELGYRAQPSARASVSISAFYNVYDHLRSFELTQGGLPIVFANEMEGETYGVEAWGAYQVTDWWRLTGGFNWLHKDLRYQPGSSKIVGVDIAGDDPDHQASLRSMMDLGRGLALDLDLRHVGSLPRPASPSYAELDARVRWAASKSLEISLIGANLLHKRHPEFGVTGGSLQLGPIGVKSSRSIFIDTRWRF